MRLKEHSYENAEPQPRRAGMTAATEPIVATDASAGPSGRSFGRSFKHWLQPDATVVPKFHPCTDDSGSTSMATRFEAYSYFVVAF